MSPYLLGWGQAWLGTLRQSVSHQLSLSAAASSCLSPEQRNQTGVRHRLGVGSRTKGPGYNTGEGNLPDPLSRCPVGPACLWAHL
jgi:hypothetical protein